MDANHGRAHSVRRGGSVSAPRDQIAKGPARKPVPSGPGRRNPSATTRPTNIQAARRLATTPPEAHQFEGGPNHATNAGNPRAGREEMPGRRPPLGSSGDVIPLGSSSWQKSLSRYELRDRAREAWRVLGSIAGDDRYRTTRLCGVPLVSNRDGVEIRTLSTPGSATRAAVVGTSSCGSANGVCPVCSARVREVRRVQIQEMIAVGLEAGYRFALVTGTLRHTRETTVAEQRNALEECWRAVTQGKQAQQRKHRGTVAGTVRSIEFMLCGPAGPHGHVHALVAVAAGVADAEVGADFEAMGERWKKCAESNMRGLRPNDSHGWHWEYTTSAENAVDYVTKAVDGDGWNVTHEIARGDAKRGRAGSLTPLELLGFAVGSLQDEGDIGPMLRMSEYATAVKGMRSIVVSRSFAQAMAAPVDERTDEDIADESETMEGDWKTVARLSSGSWLTLTRTYGVARILSTAAQSGNRGVIRLLRKVNDRPQLGNIQRAG